MSDGLVVASCGWYSLIDLKSPVSATIVVWFLRLVRLFDIMVIK
jgi:hypothetical protein